MKIEDFNYELPEELIAQYPAKERDQSRMMVFDQTSGQVQHWSFKDFAGFIQPGDCLVLNQSRVIPARLFGEKLGTGGKVELLLTRDLGQGKWEALINPKKRAKPGTKLSFSQGQVTAEIIEFLEQAGGIVQFSPVEDWQAFIDKEGKVPLPPYITRPAEPMDSERYQTVYARENGSIASPTAGLHFTPAILDSLRQKGVCVAELTLHVGWGTFKPVRDLDTHKMHPEYVRITEQASQTINQTLEQGKRLVCVGTTSTRALEWAATEQGRVQPKEGWCDLFIMPGYKFKVVKNLLTNFHLPGSSLLLLVSAFIGREKLLELYAQAVKDRYRFYSYGDCMLIID